MFASRVKSKHSAKRHEAHRFVHKPLLKLERETHYETLDNGPDSNVCRLRHNGRNFRVGKIGVKAGLATYRRWYTAKVPAGTERYKIYGPRNPFTGKRTWTYGYRPKFEVKKIPLPNHHQPYVAFRLYATGGNSSGGSKPTTHGLNYKVKIHNPNRSFVKYSFGGQRQMPLRGGYVRTHRGTGQPSIVFDNGRRQTVRYRLSRNGQYVFRWVNGTLQLYRR